MNDVSVGFVAGSVAVVAGIIAAAKFAENAADKRNGNVKNKQMQQTRRMVNIAMLAAVAIVLMLFEFPLPMIAPPFYELDLSDTEIGQYIRNITKNTVA